MIIQIYAFTKISDALAAVEAGVDQIGFVAGKYGVVHGELSFSEAYALVSALPSGIRKVALTMSTDVAEISRMVAAVEPDIVHISTEPDEVDIAAMLQLRKHIPSHVGLMKAISVEDEQSIALAKRFAAVSDLLLLDTHVRGLPGVGATGKTHDWNISRQIIESVDVPVILAGGLTPENVAEAIAITHPWGVDLNTSTNKTGDLVQKDLDRIASFVKAVRGAV